MIKFLYKMWKGNIEKWTIKKVTIIGLGALGILFGNHLAKRMPKEDLRIIADEKRIQKYKNEHVYCNGEKCDFHYVTPDETCEPADLLIFTVKYEGLHEAIQAVKNHVDENTIILSALNGITSEAIIGRSFWQGSCPIIVLPKGWTQLKWEINLHTIIWGCLCFGDQKSGIISESVKSVAAFFEKMDFPYQVDTNMDKRLWGKFMLNVGVNQTVAVYKSNYGEIQREGEARETMIAAMREVITLSEYEGIQSNRG